MSTQEVKKIDTVVVGGGQSGLATSYLLTQAGRDHIIFEKSEEIGHKWRGRWDSFTLVTPNWQLQLPGHTYEGENPRGFLSKDEVVAYLEDYAHAFDPPLNLGEEVSRVVRDEEDDRYLVVTTDGRYAANNVVVATGAFQSPDMPDFSAKAPQWITQIHSSDYENPDALPEGAVLVVGSGQSGSQIARELNESGRQVYLCISNAGRLPRRYRGKDGMWWAMKLGLFSQTVHQLDSPAERFAANPQISGKDGGQDINLHEFARDGIRLLGHLRDFKGDHAVLSMDMHETLRKLDKMEAGFRQSVDEYVEKTGLDVPAETVVQPQDGFAQKEVAELDLREMGVQTIIWATGFDRDYSFVELPVFDEFGYPIQERGVTDVPGLYFVGLHWLHTLKSGLFLGVGGDAEHVVEHIEQRDELRQLREDVLEM